MVLIVTYLLPFILVRAPFYDRKVGTLFGLLLDYGFSLRSMDADVVVFGDSSAIYAFDPVQAGEALQLKIVNIPSTASSLAVTRDSVLRRYLQHNKPPRLIVFHFMPWELDFDENPHTNDVFEGEDILLRFGSVSEILGYFRHHPLNLLNYPLEVYAAVPEPTIVSFLHHAAGQEHIVSTHGHVDVPAHYRSLHEDCKFPDSLLKEFPTTSVDSLLSAYRTEKTQTLLYLSPIPSCAGADILTSRSYREGTTQPPIALQPDFFSPDFTHIRTPGVPRSTELFIQALRPVLAAQDLQR